MMFLQKQRLKRFAGALLLLLGFGCMNWGFGQDYPRFEENSLYVKFKDQSAVSAKKMLQQKNGEKQIKTALLGLPQNVISRYKILPEAVSMSLFDNPVLDKTFMIQVDPEAKAGIEQLMQELQKNPDIEYVERVPFNRIFSNDSPKTVNDPFYGIIETNDAEPKKINVSWHLDLIHAEKAWELQTGDSNVIVAVVDNAVWGEHEDLQIPANRQYNCVKKMAGNSSPEVSAQIQDAQCEMSDIYSNQCTAYDFSHGTHCAGAIAAINNNGKGIASIGGGLTLLGIGGPNNAHPMGVYNSYHGVAWAVEHGAKIISCSWGGAENSVTNEAVMKECYDKGVIVIAAAGNDNVNTPHYPAAYTPYVISVGSVDANRHKSSFSNYGYWIDMLSPGGQDTAENYKTQIFSTTFCQNQYTRLFGGSEYFTNAYYDEMSGTSMATPVLAGVVGLLVSMDTSLNTDQVRAILQNTGQDAQSYYGRTDFNTYCRVVDAYAALQYLNEKKKFGPNIPLSNITFGSEHDSVWLEWEAPQTTETITGYRVYRNGTLVGDNLQTRSFLDTNQRPGTLRYAIEPVYENLLSLRTEVDILVKTYYQIQASIMNTLTGIQDTNCGHVNGVGSYAYRTRHSLEAVPADGYAFDYWTDESGTRSFGTTQGGITMKNRRFFAWFTPQNSNENTAEIGKTLRISPNPTSDDVRIQCDEYEITEIRIFDLQGKEYYKQATATHDLTLSIASWPKGTYMVQVRTPQGRAAQKLIKQ